MGGRQRRVRPGRWQDAVVDGGEEFRGVEAVVGDLVVVSALVTPGAPQACHFASVITNKLSEVDPQAA